MDRLPVEILTIILDNIVCHDDPITRAALRGLRHSCKRLADLAAPHLFKTLPLWLGATSLSNLAGASQHPIISTYVTGIVFSPIVLSQGYVKDEERIHQEISYRFASGEGSAEERETQEKEYRHAWRSFLNDFEKHFCESGEGSALEILTRTLSALPNLSSVVIDCAAYHVGASEIFRTFGRTFGTEFDRTGGLTVPILFNALVASKTALQRFAISAEEADWQHRERLKDVVLSSERVELDYSLRESGFDQRGLETAIRLNLSSIQQGPLFIKLKSLELLDTEITRNNPTAIQSLAKSVETILSANWDTLQKLHIGRIRSYNQLDQLFSATEAIPGPAKFSNIQFLTLQCCKITETVLKYVIVDSAAALKYVLLDRIQLFDGSWSSFVEVLQQQDFPKLQEFMIVPDDDEDEGAEGRSPCNWAGYDIARYLTRTKNINPGIVHDLLLHIHAG